MKIRSDFVSNSSSSSFIVAVSPNVSNNQFAKDIAKSCVNKKSEFHQADSYEHNKIILDFCLNNYQLLFLGELVLDAKNDGYVSNVIVTNDEMSCKFMRYCDAFADTLPAVKKKDTEERVRRIIARSKGALNEQRNYFESSASPQIFAITLDTIKNTRELLSQKHKIIFDKWEEDLDTLEKRLNEGQRLFSVKVAYQGDGRKAYHVYCEDDADMLKLVRFPDCEILNSENC